MKMNRLVKISDIAKINANSLTQNDNFQEIIYLDTGSITKNIISNTQKLNFNTDKIPSRAKRKVRDRTIIYSTVRPNQEHYGFLENPADNFIVSTGFTTIDISDAESDAKYIFYLLTQKYITDYLHMIGENSVSSYPAINPNDLANLKFSIPNLKTQKSIAHILSTLDQKIAINNQINAQLEQMAKTLYDYWFVQFDFPDENGKPYKSSGGEMVYNDTLKREIPKGWEVKSLGEVVDLKNGINYSASDYGDTQAKIVNVRDVSNCSIFIKSNELDILSLDNKKLLPYQINEKNILVVRSGKPGATRLLGNVKDLTIYCGFIIAIVPKKEIMRNLIFWFLKNQELKIESQSAGTVLKNVSQDTLKGSLFLIPNSENLILKFNTLIDDIFKKICCFDEQNQQLTQLRDFLLPMLMNGQVGVGDD